MEDAVIRMGFAIAVAVPLILGIGLIHSVFSDPARRLKKAQKARNARRDARRAIAKAKRKAALNELIR